MPENPLAALGPIAWESLDCTDLGSFLAETFACAQIIADSVPAPASMSSLVPSSAAPTGRPRSHTDGAVSYNPARLWGRTGSNPAVAVSKDDGLPSARERKLHELRQSWKEVVRAGGANNPRDIVVFKMNGGRDGYAGSSWFARRSLHKKTAERAGEGKPVIIDFETFRRGLLHEFDLEAAAAAENKNKKPTPVRTMVTKRRVEHVVHRSDGTPQGELSIYLLEADFPGPTASRDFVTMLLTTESQHSPSSTRFGGAVSRPCRQFMLVSKPCHHPETPARPGFVRAQYESVEMIREVPVPRVGEGGAGTRRTRSSIDLGHEQQDTDLNETHEMAIEWIMITRNNPGGSVPRFLVDKSTPGSIISDANKFLDWLAARAWAAAHTAAAEAAQNANSNSTTAPGTAMSVGGLGAAIHEEEEEEAAAAAAAAARRAGGAA